MAPFFIPAKAPSGPIVTARRSLSLPTQHITKSWPSAAAFGVAAVLPPNLLAHSAAFAPVRLYTVTSWPPFFTRCPAMGKPMTPRPRKATLAMCVTLKFAGDWAGRTVFSEGAAPYKLRRAGQRLRLAGGAGFVLGWGPEEPHKKGVTSHGRQRGRARPFQHPDPQPCRYGPVL